MKTNLKFYKILLLCFFISFLAFIPNAKASALTARDVALMVDAVDTSKTAEFSMTMHITRNNQKLVRVMSMKNKKDDIGEKQYIHFQEPSDVRDTSYVIWTYKDVSKDDDMWIYLPANGMVRRISGGGKKGAFMRSDYANEDISSREVDLDMYSNLREEELSGVACYVIEATPKEPEKTNFSKRILWIRKDIMLPAKIDYYDFNNVHYKELVFGGFKEIQSIWTATRQRMRSLLQNSETIIEVKETRYNAPISNDTFQWQNLKR